MGEVVDGEYQKYVVSGGKYIREHFFGKYPELLELVKDIPDEQLAKLKRGGHDPVKVYAAYKAAVEHKGSPTVILVAHGQGLRPGRGRRGHEQRPPASRSSRKSKRSSTASAIASTSPSPTTTSPTADFYKPADDSPEMKYLHERRKALGGYLPQRASIDVSAARRRPARTSSTPTPRAAGKDTPSTTMVFVDMLDRLLKDTRGWASGSCRSFPTRRAPSAWTRSSRRYKIYSSVGQLYEPVDEDTAFAYREAKNGQILEEGITEAGSMSSFIAAGTAYATHGVPTIPFFIYYSMFGFQRIGDLIWAAADMRAAASCSAPRPAAPRSTARACSTRTATATSWPRRCPT